VKVVERVIRRVRVLERVIRRVSVVERMCGRVGVIQNFRYSTYGYCIVGRKLVLACLSGEREAQFIYRVTRGQ
jgi:hypothetical protein